MANHNSLTHCTALILMYTLTTPIYTTIYALIRVTVITGYNYNMSE